MRHAAWLNARPEKVDGDKSKAPELTRRQQLEKDGIDNPEMPPCTAHYMVAFFFEVGPCASSGMGDAPLSHSEIAAWMQNTGIRLNPWEARTLRRLSIAYLNESQKATKRGHPAPWQSDGVAIDKIVAANSMKNALRDLANL